jgi:YD repeat-containing protein
MLGSPAPAYADEVTYITEYIYDLNGNVETRTTPDGDTIQYEYDSLNRLTRKIYPDLSEVTYVYDANGNRIEMTDSHGTTYYGYDRFNRVTGVQISGINPTYYEYDNANNLTKITYASEEEVNYEIADYIFY